MKLLSSALKNDQIIPGDYAFCIEDSQQHATLGPNKNPAFEWSELPAGTKSLVLICHDPDVPTRPDDVNKEGRVVPADLPRTNFYHWVLVDLSLQPARIEAGEFSNEVTPRGKSGPEGPRGTRQGINSYRDWFEGDPDMGGDYFGYDGPCPPWNDSLLHHYVFTLYALDVERCPVEGSITAQDVLEAIDGHILDQATLMGTYSLNPDVQA